MFVVNVDWFFLSHRIPIAREAKQAGFNVFVAAADTGKRAEIERYGFQFIPLSFLEEKGSLLEELQMIRKLTRLYKELQPDIVHHVTVRPVLYGSIAARRARVPALVNLFSGLGHLFAYHTLKYRLMRRFSDVLFRYGFAHPVHRLVLQNRDDRQTVLDRNLLPEKNIRIIRGSGVDTGHFKPDPAVSEEPRISYFGRLLWSKGLKDLISAAEIVYRSMPEVEFHLYGEPYPANPLSVPMQTVEEWKKLPNLTIHGHISDVLPAMLASSVICLPARLREGLPKTLLEAAAAGKPLLATDVPGCREIVQPGVNGYLVPPGRADLLAERILHLMKHPGLRKEFGHESRKIVMSDFSVELVTSQTMKVYDELLQKI